MKLLKKFSVLITFAAFGVCGPPAWAHSFVAKAELNGDNVVPPVLTTATGELCLTISEPETSSEPSSEAETGGQAQTLAVTVPTNPWQYNLGKKGAVVGIPIRSIRLYFGQSFANGQPILTLCDDDTKVDDDMDEDECLDEDTASEVEQKGTFDLNSIQFQLEQVDQDDQTDRLVDEDGRLHNDESCEELARGEQECGFSVIKGLIERGLIYIVVNSDFKAIKRNDGTIRYKPPKRTIVVDREIRLVVDGDARGTLNVDEELDECPTDIE